MKRKRKRKTNRTPFQTWTYKRCFQYKGTLGTVTQQLRLMCSDKTNCVITATERSKLFDAIELISDVSRNYDSNTKYIRKTIYEQKKV